MAARHHLTMIKSSMPVITVSRQYGSLGDEIAQDVAARLQLRLVDQDMINEVAQRLGVSPATVTGGDERGSNVVTDLVRTMRRLYPATLTPSTDDPEVDEASYLQVIRQVIWEVARSADAVIMGRGASFILESHPEVLHVLFVAPLHVRTERVMAAEGLQHEEAVRRIKEVDAKRARYVRHFYRTNWLDVSHYDLVIGTGHFSQLSAVNLICSAVQLAVPPSPSN
jgi:cytidylate kinase